MDPTAIVAKVSACFENACNTGDLLYFPSTIVKHVDSGVEYEIRLCPALQHKPHLPTPHFNAATDAGLAVQGNRGKLFDPFAPPYNVNLHVGELRDEESQEEFVVLLNKFSIVPQHFLLVTKEFKSQASPLMPPELVQTYLLLSAGRKSGKKLFAFFNCGDNSGASQAHKHIQFIPIGDEDGPPIERLAREARLEFGDKPFSLRKLSYASHSYRFPSSFDTYPLDRLESVISDAFLQLLDLSISTIRHDPDYPTGSPSYNVIITLEHLHIIPRRQENHTLEVTGEKLSVNALGFAGMLLVKSEEELEAVKQETISVILRGVGLESVHDMQVEGTSQETPLAGL
ncbi:ATP adenylyltransferase-domain-containing protein [Crassisporium funariophilum]|nr:ATP adenylyltransferase-domain-containing protein [Crassisporium funariophilum]